jgi:transposase
MSKKKYIVNLKDDEKKSLLELVKKGKARARRITRARILLLADEEKTDEEIVAALKSGVATVERIRKRFVEGNLEFALSEAPRPKRGSMLDGKGHAVLVATACSTPPDGRASWSMQLLAERLVELKVVDSISDETVRQLLKKTRLSRGKKSSGVSRR